MEFPEATGIILAGGNSERFGPQNKALAEYQNRPLIHHVTSELLEVTPSVIISCRADQQPDYEQVLVEYDDSLSFALDPTPGAGPLLGLKTACEQCTTAITIVLACDMPLVHHELLADLLRKLEETDAVIPRTDDGWLHLTHAAYRVPPLREAINQATHNGKDRLLDLLPYLEYTPVTETQINQVSDVSAITSIDSQNDLADIQHE